VVKIPDIGLVNVLAGRRIAQEFVQDAVQPVAMADALDPLLRADSHERAQMVRDLTELRASLGEPGAAKRVATMALTMAGRAA
jgi:lipid-A-disaccharide synthase